MDSIKRDINSAINPALYSKAGDIIPGWWMNEAENGWGGFRAESFIWIKNRLKIEVFRKSCTE